MQTFEQLRSQRLQQKDFTGYLLMFASHKRFGAFLEIQKQMPDADYWECLSHVWQSIEVSFPERNLWLALFQSERSHRNCLMNESERKTLAALPEQLTVFRGYAKGKGKAGLSWTLSKTVAEFFARDYASGGRRAILCGHATNTPGMIVTGRCDKRDVLAFFDEREEKEIVIRPERVRSTKSAEVVRMTA